MEMIPQSSMIDSPQIFYVNNGYLNYHHHNLDIILSFIKNPPIIFVNMVIMADIITILSC